MIIRIDGPAKSGKTWLAQALRSAQISHKRGALILDEDTPGEPEPLVEKIVKGMTLPRKGDIDLSKVPWKDEPSIIVIGDGGAQRLAKIEERFPGFTLRFGPLTQITIS